VIVHCNFEELTALRVGAHQVLGGYAPERGLVAAPAEERGQVASLLPLLDGDFSIETLAEQRVLCGAVSVIVETLRLELETTVTATHPAHEGAVAAYFDFAHAFSVRSRLVEIGQEMTALIELVTEAPVTDEVAREFLFSD